MAEIKGFNIWWLAYLYSIGEGLSFNVGELLLTLIQIFANGRIPGIPVSDINMIDAVLLEAYQAVLKITDNPSKCALDISVNVLGTSISRKAIKALLKMFNAPQSKVIGGFRLGWA